MDRRFQKAVVSAFRNESADTICSGFAAFDERDWKRGSPWMHTSGLALYLLGRIRELGIEHVIPPGIRRGLEVNLEQNRTRTQDLFGEFVRINVGLQRAKLSYANLKGFTLTPRACPDPAYRYQHDLDLLMAGVDSECCRQILEGMGYRLTGYFGNTMEFSDGDPEVCRLADLYTVRKQRSVEVHCADVELREGEHGDGCDDSDRLMRLRLQVWNGFEFPALSECDKLLGQALHLFKHFRSEWTRTAWMLEYATAIRSHAGDNSFWPEVTDAIAHRPEVATAIGAATLLTMEAFGVEPPADFVACTVDAMPPAVRRWFARYGDDVVYVEFPGTKLYLLLQDVLFESRPDWHRQRRRRLLPFHLPRPSMPKASDAAGILAVRLLWARLRFVLLRLRFHLFAGLRYKLEAARWKILSAAEVER